MIQDSHRLHYLRTAAKAVMKTEQMAEMTDCNMSDVSIVADASGGMGTVFHPHMHKFHKNEVQRHNLLKVHTQFVKVLSELFCFDINNIHCSKFVRYMDTGLISMWAFRNLKNWAPILPWKAYIRRLNRT